MQALQIVGAFVFGVVIGVAGLREVVKEPFLNARRSQCSLALLALNMEMAAAKPTHQIPEKLILDSRCYKIVAEQPLWPILGF